MNRLTSPSPATPSKFVRFGPIYDNIGYLRITTFSEQTSPGLNDAVEKIFTEHGDSVKGFVLDLRNNPGGL